MTRRPGGLDTLARHVIDELQPNRIWLVDSMAAPAFRDQGIEVVVSRLRPGEPFDLALWILGTDGRAPEEMADQVNALAAAGCRVLLAFDAGAGQLEADERFAELASLAAACGLYRDDVLSPLDGWVIATLEANARTFADVVRAYERRLLELTRGYECARSVGLEYREAMRARDEALDIIGLALESTAAPEIALLGQELMRFRRRFSPLGSARDRVFDWLIKTTRRATAVGLRALDVRDALLARRAR